MAELSVKRQLGAPEYNMLTVQSNLARTYSALGRFERGLLMQRDVYLGILKLHGNRHEKTLREAYNYTSSLIDLKRFEEAKTLLRRTMPVVRRVFGENDDLTLRMRSIYAQTLYEDPGATLDDLREAVTTLEDVAPIARRVLGGAHPVTVEIEESLQNAQAALSAALRARERPPARADAIDAR